MKIFDARDAVKDALQALGLYRGAVDHPMVVPLCRYQKVIVMFVK